MSPRNQTFTHNPVPPSFFGPVATLLTRESLILAEGETRVVPNAFFHWLGAQRHRQCHLTPLAGKALPEARRPMFHTKLLYARSGMTGTIEIDD